MFGKITLKVLSSERKFVPSFLAHKRKVQM